MKKLVIIFLLVCSTLTAQTRPSWYQLKDKPVVNVLEYGVSTTSADNSAAMQAALDTAKILAIPAYFPKSGTYAFLSKITIDPHYTGITSDAGDVILDFSGAGAINCMEYRATPLAGAGNIDYKRIVNCGWKLKANVTQTGISLLDITGLTDTHGVTFNNIAIRDAGIGVSIATNSWQITFNDYSIASCAVCVYAGDNTMTNTGEQITFNNGIHSGANCLAYKSENYGSEVIFNNCSIDTERVAAVDTGASVTFNDCWFESQLDGERNIDIQGSDGRGGASVTINGGRISNSVNGIPRTNPYVYCGDVTTPSFGGFYCSGTRLELLYPVDDIFYFVEGSGRAYFSSLRTGTYGFNSSLGGVVLANSLNSVYDGSFEGADYTTSGWTPYTVDTSTSTVLFTNAITPKTGSKCLSIVASQSLYLGLEQDFPCAPGDTVWGGFYYKIVGLASASMFVSASFRNDNDIVIGEELHEYSPADEFSTLDVDWTWQPFNTVMRYTPAPAGTTKLKFIVYTAGSVFGDGHGYLDNLNINIIK